MVATFTFTNYKGGFFFTIIYIHFFGAVHKLQGVIFRFTIMNKCQCIWKPNGTNKISERVSILSFKIVTGHFFTILYVTNFLVYMGSPLSHLKIAKGIFFAIIKLHLFFVFTEDIHFIFQNCKRDFLYNNKATLFFW